VNSATRGPGVVVSTSFSSLVSACCDGQVSKNVS
jgi:hypothetical protein